MKRSIFVAVLFLMVCGLPQIQAQEIKQLPEPQKEGGKSLMKALNQRHSSRTFADKEMSDQMLSDLLWAAFGINRPESGKRTAPSAHNIQDIQIYITTRNGAYLYLPEKNALKQITDKDVRANMGMQDFVKNVSVNLVYVSDFSKYSDGSEQQHMITAGTHCGFIGQNVYLFCASEGLNCVFRGSINKELISKTLNLEENQHVMYSQSVGFPKK
ncbi:MAG: SagB/ThcOx family dehydrogenase [Bacteroidales bacterium]|nr:SagB/ThcOx family dehydrogenase [Bacteroidales bacterium]